MNEWSEKILNPLKLFLKEYGKVVLFIFLLLISYLIIIQITFLSTRQPLRVSFLDVGQGDAILVQTPSGRTMLIDGGATDIVLSRLSKRLPFFSKTVDVMIESHPDADHITGLIPVLEKYKITTMVRSLASGNTQVFEELEKRIDSEGAQMYSARFGDIINFHDGVIVHILYPTSNYSVKKNDTNDASVSVLITYGEASFLLTGDLPSTQESKLISKVLPKDITVFKAGHHGSKYSSGEQLLSYIRPEYSVVSAGKDNKYEHPNVETLERLGKYSEEIISTVERGTITFVTEGRGVQVETER